MREMKKYQSTRRYLHIAVGITGRLSNVLTWKLEEFVLIDICCSGCHAEVRDFRIYAGIRILQRDTRARYLGDLRVCVDWCLLQWVARRGEESKHLCRYLYIAT